MKNLSRLRVVRQVMLILSLSALLTLPMFSIAAQTPSAEELKRDRNRGLAMLQLMKDYLKEHSTSFDLNQVSESWLKLPKASSENWR